MTTPGDGTITYNHAGVSDLADQVGQRAAHLMEMHDDVQRRTNAVAEFFQGEAGKGFHEAQTMMLSGFEDLIAVVSRHGSTIEAVRASAHSADLNGATLFT